MEGTWVGRMLSFPRFPSTPPSAPFSCSGTVRSLRKWLAHKKKIKIIRVGGRSLMERSESRCIECAEMKGRGRAEMESTVILASIVKLHPGTLEQDLALLGRRILSR